MIVADLLRELREVDVRVPHTIEAETLVCEHRAARVLVLADQLIIITCNRCSELTTEVKNFLMSGNVRHRNGRRTRLGC